MRQRRRVELRCLVRRQLGGERLGDVVPADARRLVGDGAGRGGIPVEAERLVDGDEDVAHALALAHHDHAADVPRALDQALPDAGELDLPARVDASSRRGSTRAGPRRRAHRRRAAAARARRSPATLRKRSCVPDQVSCARPGPRERDRVLVEDGCPPAGEPLDRLEAAGARRVRRVGIAGARRSSLPNATIAPGRARRNVSGSSPRATRSRIARETAVS